MGLGNTNQHAKLARLICWALNQVVPFISCLLHCTHPGFLKRKNVDTQIIITSQNPLKPCRAICPRDSTVLFCRSALECENVASGDSQLECKL